MEVMQLFHQIFSNGNDKGLSKEGTYIIGYLLTWVLRVVMFWCSVLQMPVCL